MRSDFFLFDLGIVSRSSFTLYHLPEQKYGNGRYLSKLSDSEVFLMNPVTIYLSAMPSSVINHTKLRIQDAITVYCSDPGIQKEVENIILYTFHSQMDGRQVISILKVIEEINTVIPNANVINLGNPDFVVFHKKYAKITKKSKLMEHAKILFVCLVIFFGSAFTIMTYNNDVSVEQVFNEIYQLFMGTAQKSAGVLQFGYSIGITTGLIFFFNHVGNHRLTDEPTPLEVQMRLYERDVNDAVTISSARNKKTLDVK